MAAVTLGAQTAVTTNAATYNSGAFTTPNDGLSRLLVAVCAVTAQTATDWAATDNVGGSPGWTKVRRQVKASSADILEVWVRNGLIAPNTSCTVTYSHPSGNASGGCVRVWQVSGMSLTGSSAIRSQGGQDNQAASTTPAPALNQNALTGNPTLTAIFNATSPSGVTQPSGWTGETDQGFSSPTTGTRGARRDSGFTSATITWGSTSASIFCSVAVELDTANPVTVSLGVGAATLTGFAAVIGLPVTVVAGLASASAVGFTPTISEPITAQPGVGSSTATAYAPTVGLPITLTPGTGAVDVTGWLATVQTPTVVQPGVGLATGTALAPTIGVPVTVTPPLASADLAGLAPTVGVPLTVNPGLGVGVTTGFAASVDTGATGVTVLPGTGVGAYDGLSPAVHLPVTIAVDAGTLSIGGLVPVLGLPVTAAPGSGSVVCTGYPPVVDFTTTVLLGTGSVSLTGYDPTVGLPVSILIPGSARLRYLGQPAYCDIGKGNAMPWSYTISGADLGAIRSGLSASADSDALRAQCFPALTGHEAAWWQEEAYQFLVDFIGRAKVELPNTAKIAATVDNGVGDLHGQGTLTITITLQP